MLLDLHLRPLALGADPASPLVGAGPDLSWLLTVVAVLLAAILGVAWAMRRVLAGAWRARASKRSLRVVDVLPLGGRRQLAVVRCYDRTFALGLGEKDVALVAELDPEFVEEQGPEPKAEEPGRNPFVDLVAGAQERLAARRTADRLRTAGGTALERAEAGLPASRQAGRTEEGVVA